MLAFLNTPTFPVFSPPTYFNPAFILRFYLSLIFYLALIFYLLCFFLLIYHVMRTDTCNKPHTLRDAVTGRNRNSESVACLVGTRLVEIDPHGDIQLSAVCWCGHALVKCRGEGRLRLRPPCLCPLYVHCTVSCGGSEEMRLFQPALGTALCYGGRAALMLTSMHETLHDTCALRPVPNWDAMVH